MQHFPDSYAVFPEGRAIARKLIEEKPEFAHLETARLAFLSSQRTLWLHGGKCAAFVATPKVQGPLRDLFGFMLAQLVAPQVEGEDPDFVVLVDAAIWSGLDPERQERLVYHELCHIVQAEDEYQAPRFKRDGSGDPLLKLVPHDTEVFTAEILTYGPVVCGLIDHARAIAAGHEAAQKRLAEATDAESPRRQARPSRRRRPIHADGADD